MRTIAGLTGEEYVYIVPDYVRFENQTYIWTDRTEGTLSSRYNVKSRQSIQNIMFVRYSTLHFHFIQRCSSRCCSAATRNYSRISVALFTRLKSGPFTIQTLQTISTVRSSRLFFTMASTCTRWHSIKRWRTDRVAVTDAPSCKTHRICTFPVFLMQHKQQQQQRVNAGVSGYVVMDNIGGREPTFVLSGFSKSGNLTRFLKVEMYHDLQVALCLLRFSSSS